MGIGTRLVHKTSPVDQQTGAVVPGIEVASTFQQQALGRPRAYEYARTNNPTRDTFERAMADIEGGVRGLAFASGMAAISTVASLMEKGDHVVAGNVLYGGTPRVFDNVFSRLGVHFTYVDARDASQVKDALRPETRMVFVETPTNPLLGIVDLKAVAKAASGHDAFVAVDSTFASPIGQFPLKLGCDIVVHSATKYIGGHSDLLAGTATTSDAELAERLAYLQNAMGSVASPFDSFLALRGMRTLHLRMQRHTENALAVARFLERHGKVSAVHYPGLKSHPQHELASRQQSLAGGMLSFEVEGGRTAVRRVLKALNVFQLAESLGSVESLASYPAMMTHASLTERRRRDVGIGPGLVRLSVGIEDADDLVADLRQALSKV